MSEFNGPVLVVGGCGLLGRSVVEDLLRSCNVPQPQIAVLDLEIDRNPHPAVSYYEGDISDGKKVLAVLEKVKPEVILHHASPQPWAYDYDYYTKVNVEGTRNLVEYARKVGITKAFVYTSSSSVVHDSLSDLIDVDESVPVLFYPQQQELYHHSKALAETLVLEANRKDGHMLTVAIRPSGIFGLGDTATIPKLIDNARSGNYKVQIGDGKNLFDWTYVDNAARAHVLAAQALLAAHSSSASIRCDERVDGEAFFITNDEPVPFWDFARSVGEAAGYPTKLEDVTVIPKSVGLLLGTIMKWITWITSFGRKAPAFSWRGAKYSTQIRTFRIDKAKQRLHYRPSVSVHEGIRRSVPMVAGDKKND